MRASDVLGRWGEDLAAQRLQAEGLEILDRNWRCPAGEIDIVARDRQAVVFCEVKTRRGTGYGQPLDAITSVKALRMRRLAAQWLAANRPAHALDVRFDVVGILVASPEPVIEYLRGVLG